LVIVIGVVGAIIQFIERILECAIGIVVLVNAVPGVIYGVGRMGDDHDLPTQVVRKARRMSEIAAGTAERVGYARHPVMSFVLIARGRVSGGITRIPVLGEDIIIGRIVSKHFIPTGGQPVPSDLPKSVVGKGLIAAVGIINLDDPFVRIPRVRRHVSALVFGGANIVRNGRIFVICVGAAART